MRLLFGEMSSILLEGSRVTSKKITDSGFNFRYLDINDALKDLLNEKHINPLSFMATFSTDKEKIKIIERNQC